jgi:hypothetical protein
MVLKLERPSDQAATFPQDYEAEESMQIPFLVSPETSASPTGRIVDAIAL